MKQRQPSREQWQVGIKHVSGQTEQAESQQVTAEVHEPKALRNENADGAHADDERTFHPHARDGENERGIAKPQKIRRPVRVQIDRDEDGKERSDRYLCGQWNFYGRGVQSDGTAFCRGVSMSIPK